MGTMTLLKLADCDSIDEMIEANPDLLSFQGKFIITDGCYVMPDEVWQECIDFWDWEDTDQCGRDWIMVEINGHKIVMFSTAYGDGCYAVTESSEVCGSADVDSGTLAIIPVEFAPDKINELVERGSGVIIELEHEREFDCEERGIVQIGSYRVDTKNDLDEDEDEEEDWEDEEDDV